MPPGRPKGRPYGTGELAKVSFSLEVPLRRGATYRIASIGDSRDARTAG
jgi:hypothetical protein